MPDISVINTLLHLPIGVLSPTLDGHGPYAAGSHTLTTWLDGGTTRNVSDTFGLVVMPFGAIPPEWGTVNGYNDGVNFFFDIYVPEVVQVVVNHQALSGAWLATQSAWVDQFPWLMRWAEDLPGRIGLYVRPAWQVDLFFLKTI